MRHCPNCNVPVTPGASDCMKCGALLNLDGTFEIPASRGGVPSNERVSRRGKCWIASILVLFSPILSWPFLGVFTLFGCHGNEGTGVFCSPIFGFFDISSLASIVFMFAAWGLIFTIPLGLALSLLCPVFSSSNKR